MNKLLSLLLGFSLCTIPCLAAEDEVTDTFMLGIQAANAFSPDDSQVLHAKKKANKKSKKSNHEKKNKKSSAKKEKE